MRKNDYSSGSQLNLSIYESLYPLIFFDLSFQTEKVTRDPKQLTFRYRLSENANQNFSVHTVVLYEEQIAIDKIGNELVIVYILFLYLIKKYVTKNYITYNIYKK